MKSLIMPAVCLLGMLVGVEASAAQPKVSGLVRLADGLPVPGRRWFFLILL